MENSKIAWCNDTFNPWKGCTKVSEGCKHCYAETLMKRYGLDVWGPTAKRERTSAAYWKKPIAWNKEAENWDSPRRVFCGSLCDVFEDNQQVRHWRQDLFTVIEDTPRLTWLLLTKRPENVDSLPLTNNFWLGTTAENQEMYNIRVPILANISHAPMRFVSIEPQIEYIDLFSNPTTTAISGLIDWIIVGGESGTNCRPFQISWAREIYNQCQQVGIAFFMKQLGGHPNKRDELADFPEDLRIREFPKGL